MAEVIDLTLDDAVAEDPEILILDEDNEQSLTPSSGWAQRGEPPTKRHRTSNAQGPANQVTPHQALAPPATPVAAPPKPVLGDCPICYDQFMPDRIDIAVCCGNAFCTKCANKLKKRKESCSLCRKKKFKSIKVHGLEPR
ncbi:uncharacterized protein MONBRDRAFT_26099 [Monosiga brevicollis MX1]|uniref:RING-type domain-containing protein n=1 Tax=Monosiga brevicollis TaxID=81824 RepID=A9V1C8_MONBE|nr:uncharacterized protein MONBRDRAFT_26099 [Monosiga brevicollis MX1]EDQ88417.1 predicted protein [Monosiga brevicollis MX1]|eukprot:XP_001746521.1 hypothetical protein [Monosiga brevicollis MX1]